MGNCQGKKASTEAVTPTSRSLDINKPVPTPVKHVESTPAKPVSPTVPTTPEDEKNRADSPVAASSTDTGGSKSATSQTNVAKEKETEAETDPEPEPVVEEDAGIDATNPKTAVTEEQSTINKSESDVINPAFTASRSAISNAKSTVSDVPCYKSESEEQTATPDLAVSADDARTVDEVEVAEEKTDKSFMDKVENLRDTCCGGGAEASAETNNVTDDIPKEEIPVTSNHSRANSVSSSDPNYKKVRKLNKKLREIEAIEAKDKDLLTKEQLEKLSTKDSVLQSLELLKN